MAVTVTSSHFCLCVSVLVSPSCSLLVNMKGNSVHSQSNARLDKPGNSSRQVSFLAEEREWVTPAAAGSKKEMAVLQL